MNDDYLLWTDNQFFEPDGLAGNAIGLSQKAVLSGVCYFSSAPNHFSCIF
ncbi:MAG: hypothetical protein FD164_279 [Nitrospirae bacterium]|nr:MAG: hypothetical protein FD164_279 [Nitrospirota bacterium]